MQTIKLPWREIEALYDTVGWVSCAVCCIKIAPPGSVELQNVMTEEKTYAGNCLLLSTNGKRRGVIHPGCEERARASWDKVEIQQLEVKL